MIAIVFTPMTECCMNRAVHFARLAFVAVVRGGCRGRLRADFQHIRSLFQTIGAPSKCQLSQDHSARLAELDTADMRVFETMLIARFRRMIATFDASR